MIGFVNKHSVGTYLLTASSAGTGGGAPAEQPASTPEQQAFRQAWAELMAKLEAHGFYDALNEDGEPMSKIGAVKRTLLNCGRQRPDAFYDLDADKLRAFVSNCSEPVAGALKDRKVRIFLSVSVEVKKRQ